MKKLYLSASTQDKNIGVDGVNEETHMQRLARDVAAILSPSIQVRLNRPEMTLMEVVTDSNTWRPDFHLALHTNAMGGKESGKASGIECWIHRGSLEGDRMADLLAANLAAVTGLRIRGGKADPDTKQTEIDGGHLAEVDRTNAPAVIVEIGFHDHPQDNQVLLDKWELVVTAIANAITDYFNGAPV